MKGLKAVAILFILLFLLALCCGCVQSFTEVYYVDGSGGVHFEYHVAYDTTSDDAATVKAAILSVMDRYVKDKDLTAFAAVDESKTGKITLYILFPSLEDYDIWRGYNGREKNEEVKPTKWGIVNAYDRKLSGYLTESNVAAIRSYLDLEVQELPLTADFYYTYGTTAKSTISNGERSQKDGIYYHTWKLDPDNETDMVIRVYGLNLAFMYLGAILIFVLSLAIIFVIIFLKKRKDRQGAEITRGNPRVFDEAIPRAEEEDKE